MSVKDINDTARDSFPTEHTLELKMPEEPCPTTKPRSCPRCGRLVDGHWHLSNAKSGVPREEQHGWPLEHHPGVPAEASPSLKMPEKPTGDPYRDTYPSPRDWSVGLPRAVKAAETAAQRCGECGRRESWEPSPSWSTCPCGKPVRPGDDTRTNAYRGEELVEVRYPHADGMTCCWSREKRR